MAYFSNASEGMAFDAQCSVCKYNDEACPIALTQMTFDYEACNNKVATDILRALVKDDGTCEMYREFKKDFHDNGEKNLKLNFS